MGEKHAIREIVPICAMAPETLEVFLPTSDENQTQSLDSTDV